MPTLPSNKIHGSNSAINEGARRIQDGPLFFFVVPFWKNPRLLLENLQENDYNRQKMFLLKPMKGSSNGHFLSREPAVGASRPGMS